MRALLEYAENFEVDALTARLFFVYGPPEAPGPDAGFNATLFSPLAGVEKVSRPRGLDQKGDWTYVKDAAQGICLMLQAQGLRDRAFNIATGIFHPLKGIMETITRHARCDPSSISAPAPTWNGVLLSTSPGPRNSWATSRSSIWKAASPTTPSGFHREKMGSRSIRRFCARRFRHRRFERIAP